MNPPHKELAADTHGLRVTLIQQRYQIVNHLYFGQFNGHAHAFSSERGTGSREENVKTTREGSSMSLALWMVLLAGLMPYLTVGFAKFSGGRYDNHHPRQWATGLEGHRARAYAAHQNHFEFFPFFAAAVIIAEWKSGTSGALNLIAVIAITARIAYTASYLANRATLRSLCWLVGVLCILALFGVAARA
jgi:uncharacterized MAPEG superfamily protein